MVSVNNSPTTPVKASRFSKFMNSSWLHKGVGIATLAAVAYDAHYLGKMEADLYATKKDGDAALDAINNSLYLNQRSKIKEGIKDFAVNYELDQGWRRYFNLGIGYVKGFVSGLFGHIVPLALGLGAVFTKGLPAKVCAGAAVVYSGIKAINNFFGVGTPGNPFK